MPNALSPETASWLLLGIVAILIAVPLLSYALFRYLGL